MMDDVRCEITDAVQTDGTWFYAWEQREANYDTGADQQPLAFASGTTTVNPAVEVNNTEVPVGTIVFIRPRGFVGGQLWFEFAHEEGSAAAPVTGQVTFSLTAITTDSTWTTIAGSQLNLPSAGIYNLKCVMGVAAHATVLPPGEAAQVYGRFADITTPALMPGSVATCFCQQVTGVGLTDSGTIVTQYTAPGPVTVEVQAYRDPATWAFCNVEPAFSATLQASFEKVG